MARAAALDSMRGVETLDIARWQFAITTIYHFLLVPITIGLSGLVALMQTQWVRTGDERYLRMTRFWGKLLADQLRARRRHRDRAGVPVRDGVERVLALRRRRVRRAAGDRGAGRVLPRVDVPRAVDLRLGPAAAAHPPRARSGPSSSATNLSAYFILAANAWMQRPVGAAVNPDRGRAELTSIWEVLTNKTALFAFGHTVTAAVMTAGMVLVGISAWHRWRNRGTESAFFSHLAALGPAQRARRRAGHDRHRPLLRAVDDEGPADEDGGRRGALRDEDERRAVAVRARRAREVARQARRQHRDPGPALVHGHRQLQRARRGHQRHPGRVRAALRPR